MDNNAMKFTKRIDAICGMVPKCGTVAEIGCDHGKVLLAIVLAGRARKGLACDISLPSLEKAKRLYSQYPDLDIEAICCDGLERAAGADCAVIAGIGGINIIEILNGNTGVKDFVLQPADSASQLRAFLSANGYGFVDEAIVKDSRYYCLMHVQYGAGGRALSSLELELGPCNIERDDCLGYAKWRLSIYDKALATPADNERGRRMQADMADIRGQLAEYIGSRE